MIKGAIFDMDGTVLDSMIVWHGLTQSLLEEFDVVISKEDYEHLEGKTQYSVCEYFVEKYPHLNMDIDTFFEKMNNKIIERYHKLAKPRIYMEEFLQELKEQGTKCAIATLTDRRHTENVLEYLDLKKYFDYILTISDVGGSKREPTIYMKCAEFMGVEVSDCMVFEDAPYAAQTAKNAGFHVCGVVEKAYESGIDLLREVSDLVVENSFEELKDTKVFL